MAAARKFFLTVMTVGLLASSLYAGDAQAAKRKKKKPACAENSTCVSSVKFVKSASEESKSERAARLKRECKGRPNAGACLGYAY